MHCWQQSQKAHCVPAACCSYIGTWHLRGVSGGQRRRVSIGCELVTSPKLIFLDEPTSGLDSAAAYYVMAAVRRLAERCRTIIRQAKRGEGLELVAPVVLRDGYTCGTLWYYPCRAGCCP